MSEGGLDLVPPSDWWHDSYIAGAVGVTPQQVADLDKAGTDDREEAAKLVRDALVAQRDLREVLDAEKPTTEDIAAAGQRLRSLRDAALERQVKVVTAQRLILTRDQWRALQEQMQARRRPQRQPGGQYPGRRPGGMGGRGRFPGMG